ncbi:DUF5337 domain-containing protein [Marinibacterium profundimaris]|uniref:DUF5337 domain-containing protein n=1 Tax=Marinibacterium profundimaris TaxID=1679460 RepID=A0A225NSU5_9RHOB|nr:DUF5337 domain-containing protein [Marinibacterium profundimaris]OWU77899.1 hypothetical protein ATO3_04505 [Marinibacterium profundimaris]
MDTGRETDQDKAIARKGRHVALVIAGAAVLWLLIQVVAPSVGLSDRYLLLFDFAALAAFVYAGVNIFQIWRMRQENQG